MRTDELVEQIVMIAILVGFLVHIFTGYSPDWLRLVLYYVSPIVLLVILYQRYKRMQEGFEFSRKIVDSQHQASGRNVVGQDPRADGVQSPYPGGFLPDQSATDQQRRQDEKR